MIQSELHTKSINLMTKLKDLEHTRIVPWVIRQILKFIYLLVSYGILYYNRFHVLKNPRESNPSQLIYLPTWLWREFFSPASPDLPPVDCFCIYIYVCIRQCDRNGQTLILINGNNYEVNKPNYALWTGTCMESRSISLQNTTPKRAEF